ncbi:MAG TPA: hypothetical protein VKR83_13510, partial [Ktedonobacteraceae bacterium]|nr:hypothetical protein [Ktedonobacteraceae bacterium]
MMDVLVRAVVLALVSLLVCAVVWYGRRFVEKRRQYAFAASPLVDNKSAAIQPRHAPIRILAFSSEDCHQCHQMQTPALQRVMEARGDRVCIEEIDAP